MDGDHTGHRRKGQLGFAILDDQRDGGTKIEHSELRERRREVGGPARGERAVEHPDPDERVGVHHPEVRCAGVGSRTLSREHDARRTTSSPDP